MVAVDLGSGVHSHRCPASGLHVLPVAVTVVVVAVAEVRGKMRAVWWPVLTARTWTLTALLSLHLLLPASSIKCLQCTSLKQRECESGDLTATPCEDPLDRYCIKYTGDTVTWR
ncbi:uncharacterized protein LOC143291335 isoform X2 [Babylonia areolata]|uniref:uncharacterized protein LOC143291335 isoform X2 n=1 Tax=Babylonia areolata TaxID=304850 RepID=UPI003FD37115